MTRPIIHGINNHQKLVRAALLTMEVLQAIIQTQENGCENWDNGPGACYKNITKNKIPLKICNCCLAYNALTIINSALYSQKVQDEHVIIAVKGQDGLVTVESKTAFVNVEIKYYE